jgi:hypothetical protein
MAEEPDSIPPRPERGGEERRHRLSEEVGERMLRITTVEQQAAHPAATEAEHPAWSTLPLDDLEWRLDRIERRLLFIEHAWM